MIRLLRRAPVGGIESTHLDPYRDDLRGEPPKGLPRRTKFEHQPTGEHRLPRTGRAEQKDPWEHRIVDERIDQPRELVDAPPLLLGLRLLGLRRALARRVFLLH